MAQTPQPKPLEKSVAAHVETMAVRTDIALDSKDHPPELMKSKFDTMSVARTAWVFRRVLLVALAVYTGYVCEGFEVSPPQMKMIACQAFLELPNSSPETYTRRL